MSLTELPSTAAPVPDLGPALDPPPRRRPLLTRLSPGHGLMIAAGLLAALVNVVLLTGGEATSSVLVGARAIAAGERVTAADFRTADVTIDDGLRANLLVPGAFDGPGSFDGWIAATAIAPGEVVRTAGLQQPASTTGKRAMSLPLEAAHAAGGNINVGDLVDVIATTPEGSAYIVTGARVTAVNRGGAQGLGSSSGASLTLEVDAAEALCLASALRGGGIDIVLATGAPAVAAAGCSA